MCEISKFVMYANNGEVRTHYCSRHVIKDVEHVHMLTDKMISAFSSMLHPGVMGYRSILVFDINNNVHLLLNRGIVV